MIRGASHRAVACFLLTLAVGFSAGGVRAVDRPAPPSSAPEAELERQRELLWRSLLKTLPIEYQRIDAYGENSGLTAVLLYSQGVVMTFSLESCKLEEIQMAKRLGQINRITFERANDGGRWVLWFNGSREATIDECADSVPLKTR